jgi:SulP family sulfate permease
LDRTTFALGAISCLIIYVLKKINKSIPSALIVVVLGITAIKLGPDLFESVAVVGYIPSGLPKFVSPSWDWNLIKDLLPIAITLAFLGFLELISIAKSQESTQDEYKVKANQEFLALGFSNIASSLFGGYACAASFSRSAINYDNGAKTPLANLISSGLMALVLLYLTPLFYDLPVAVLASIIVVAVFGLIKVKETYRLWRGSKRDFWMWIVTFVFTATFGIIQGVLIGVVVSLLVLLARSTIPHYAVLGRIDGTNYFRNISRFKDVIINPEILILRFDSELYFANADYFFQKINTLAQEKGKALKLIVLDFESVNGMDSSSSDSLKQQIESFAKRDVKMYFTNVKGPARDTMTRFNIVKELGTECFFMSIAGAVDYYETGELGIKEDLIPYINQSNKYRV